MLTVKPLALLVEGDCLTAMSAIPNRSVDMVLCDLPYGTTQNGWDQMLPMDILWEHYWRILSPRGVVALMSHGPFTAHVILSCEQHFKYKVIWVKSKATNFLNAKRQPLRKHEDICIFYNRQPHYDPQMSVGEAYDKGIRKKQLTGSYGDFRPAHIQSSGSRYPTDVVYFKTAESEGRVWHPTQKPVQLGQYLVRTYTTPGQVILDHCFGSGSFLVSAAIEGRHAMGIEINCGMTEFKQNPVDMLKVARARLQGHALTRTCKEGPDLKGEIVALLKSRNDIDSHCEIDGPYGESSSLLPAPV